MIKMNNKDNKFELLLRREKPLSDRIIGILYVNDMEKQRIVSEFYSLELPYRDNLANKSCIPLGSYKIIKHASKKFKPAFEVIDVPNRSNILLHVGNYVSDTTGCILLGLTHNIASNNIGESQKAMNKLFDYIGQQTTTSLEITDV